MGGLGGGRGMPWGGGQGWRATLKGRRLTSVPSKDEGGVCPPRVGLLLRAFPEG